MAGKRRGCFGTGSEPVSQRVVDANGELCYVIPSNAIYPTNCTKRPVLCRDWSSSGSCKMNERCHFMHVDAGLLPTLARDQVHVNRVYRTVSEVPYPTHKAGENIRVAIPNTDDFAMFPSECLLVTKGSEQVFDALHLRPIGYEPALCGHYFSDRQCHFGASCSFIHFAFVDADCITTGERAQKKKLPPNVARSAPSFGDRPYSNQQTPQNAVLNNTVADAPGHRAPESGPLILLRSPFKATPHVPFQVLVSQPQPMLFNGAMGMVMLAQPNCGPLPAMWAVHGGAPASGFVPWPLGTQPTFFQ